MGTDWWCSLPSHIDHNELTRLLSEHLACFTEVKNVKVVRDNKGGVCAFVQCQASLFPDTSFPTDSKLPYVLGRVV